MNLKEKDFNLLKFFKSFLYHIYFYKLFNKEYIGLHLGSGSNLIKGFCNIDSNPFCGCDIISTIEKIKFKSESVDIIYSSHTLEHVIKSNIKNTLDEWYRLLKKGGKLYICVPDLEILFKLYLDNLIKYDTDKGRYIIELCSGIIFGGQSDKYDFHHFGYSFNTLKNILEEVGFANIKVFSHNELTFHNILDAGSTANINGVLISLNVEATK